MASKFNIKPYDDSIGLSVFVDLGNKMAKYMNPENLIEWTEELFQIALDKETVFSRDFIVFENEKAEIVGFAGVAKFTTVKDAELAIYSILPEYFDSKLPEIVIDAIIELGNKKNPSELLIDTFGDKSAPFDKKLESLGLKPIHYTWNMNLDDFSLFKNPGIHSGIRIEKKEHIEDWASITDIINKAFHDSFKFEPFTEEKWREIQKTLEKDHVVEYCLAYDDDRMIGLCDIYINPKIKNVGYVGDFAVLPSEQGRKIGSALLAFGIEKLREKGCTSIHLDVEAKNEKALSLYEKFGFHSKENLTERTYQLM